MNWFRKGADGYFLWPGFGENSRVLKWIIERLDGRADGGETAIGVVPRRGGPGPRGLDLAPAKLDELLGVDAETWRREAGADPGALRPLRRPPAAELWQEHQDLVARLG